MGNIFINIQRTLESLGETIQHPKGLAITSTIFWFINQYIFSEWHFAIGFFGVYVMDTLSGMYVSWRMKEFNLKILKEKLFDKSVMYFSIIIGYSMATKIVLSGVETNIIKLLDIPFYSIFVTTEVISIMKNWYRYKKYPVLKRLMKNFQGFNEDNKEENHGQV